MAAICAEKNISSDKMWSAIRFFGIATFHSLADCIKLRVRVINIAQCEPRKLQQVYKQSVMYQCVETKKLYGNMIWLNVK